MRISAFMAAPDRRVELSGGAKECGEDQASHREPGGLRCSAS
jgi:hypothetical protein